MNNLRSLVIAASAIITAMTGTAQAGDISLPLSQIATSRDAGGITFSMPSLWGTHISAVRADIVIGNMEVARHTFSGSDGAFRFRDGEKILAVMDVSPDRFAYEAEFSTIPERGDTLRLEVSSSGLSCETGRDILASVDMNASRLVVEIDDADGVRLPVVEGLLGDELGRKQPLRLWTPRGVNSSALLHSASLIAQGWALRAPERKPDVQAAHLPPAQSSTFALLPGIDIDSMPSGTHVIFGTADQLAGFVSERILAEIRGPYVRVLQAPGKTFRIFVLVSGTSDSDLATAARAVGTPYFSWPDGAGVIFKTDNRTVVDAGARLPPIAWGPNDADEDDVAYSFEELGYQTFTAEGNSGAIRIPVVVPEALKSADEDDVISLSIDAAYSPGFDPSSAWTVMLGTDRFIASIPMDRPAGGRIDNATVDIPIRLLRPGRDSIVIEPHVRPEGASPCSYMKNDALKTTIFSTSAISVPYIGGAAVTRSLANWTSTGLLVPTGNYSDSTWIVASHGDETVSAVLTLLARQAADVGRPLSNLAVTYDRHAPGQNLVVIGTHSDVTSLLLNNPLPRSNAPFDAAQNEDRTIAGVFSGYANLSSIFGDQSDKKRRVLNELGNLRSNTDVPERVAAIFGYTERDKTIVGISAASRDVIYQDIAKLTANERWEKIHGDITLYDPRTDELTIRSVVNPEQRIDPATDLLGSLRNQIENNGRYFTMRWIAMGLGAIFLTAFAIRFLIGFHSRGTSGRAPSSRKERDDPSR